jgi:agmatinase
LNFFCANDNFENSSIVFLGLPFDGTSSFRSGSRFAPNEVRRISDGIESYSPYFDVDLEDVSFYDAGNVEVTVSNFAKFSKETQKRVTSFLKQDKKVLSVGGEHLVTLPLVTSYAKQYKDLKIIHFDAHADLREEYLGEKLSHATVIKRCCDIVGSENVYQFGIRSGTKEEFEFGKNNTNFNPFNLNSLKNYTKELTNFPIYLTIDLDVLDPSIFPGTGTPEPGGVTFNELLDAIKTLSGLNIVGVDLVELSPDYDNSGVSSIVTAKLIRECLILLNS